jgi:hypothetical protein
MDRGSRDGRRRNRVLRAQARQEIVMKYAMTAMLALACLAAPCALAINSWAIKKLEQGIAAGEKRGEAAKKLTESIGKINDLEERQDELYKDAQELSKEDEQYTPEYDPPGMPQLPSLCLGSSSCEACFKPPYAQLNETRFRFEKLRRVNKVTKTMLRDALSFGDAAASAAGSVAPLVWSKEKAKIRASEARFNVSYDKKYEELLGELQESLAGISECEAQMFGDHAWYDRYGFIYHSFMATAYRRPD